MYLRAWILGTRRHPWFVAFGSFCVLLFRVPLFRVRGFILEVAVGQVVVVFGVRVGIGREFPVDVPNLFFWRSV